MNQLALESFIAMCDELMIPAEESDTAALALISIITVGVTTGVALVIDKIKNKKELKRKEFELHNEMKNNKEYQKILNSVSSIKQKIQSLIIKGNYDDSVKKIKSNMSTIPNIEYYDIIIGQDEKTKDILIEVEVDYKKFESVYKDKSFKELSKLGFKFVNDVFTLVNKEAKKKNLHLCLRKVDTVIDNEESYQTFCIEEEMGKATERDYDQFDNIFRKCCKNIFHRNNMTKYLLKYIIEDGNYEIHWSKHDQPINGVGKIRDYY